MSEISLGAQGRAALKAHITSLPGWREYRTSIGKTASDMSTGDLVQAAQHLGVDLSRFAKGSAPAANPAPAKSMGALGKVPPVGPAAPAQPEPTPAPVVREVLADVDHNGQDILGGDVDQQVQDILATPFGELPAKVRELVVLANRPAEVREVFREVVKEVPVDVVREVVKEVRVPVTVDGAPVAPVPAAPVVRVAPDYSHICPVQTVKASKAFGVSGGSRFASVDVEIWNDPEAPAVDPHYEFDLDLLEVALIGLATGQWSWMGGPAGVGKTSFAEQFAARLGRAFYRINHTRTTEPQDLIGGKGLSAGSTFWEDGALSAAIRRPGAVVLIDEPTMSKPGTLAVYHPVLDGNRVLTVPDTGEKIRVAPGVYFFAADNTMGMGDDTGQYLGTENQNRAFIDRFGYSFKLDYLPKAKEVNILTKRAGVPVEVAGPLVDFARLTRTAVDQDEMTVAIGLRRLIPWALAIFNGANPGTAFNVSVLNQLDTDNQERARQLYNANVNEADLRTAVARAKGQPVDVVQTAGQAIDPDTAAEILSGDPDVDII